MNAAKPAPFLFGDFELDPTEHVLRKNGQTVPLGCQPLRALIFLVGHAGELVTREQLRDHIWGDRVTVTSTRPERVHSTDPRRTWRRRSSARIIVTMPRVGYRLGVPVTRGRSSERTTRLRPVAMATAAAGLAICAAYVVMHGSVQRPVTRSDALNLSAVFEAESSPAAAPGGFDFVRPPNLRKPEAEALLWRGRAAYESDSGGDATEANALMAQRYFQRAVLTDPSFAQAYAGVSMTSTNLATFGVDVAGSSRLADESASRALELDPSIPESHIAAAEFMYRLRGDWDGADRAYRRALAIAPDDAFVHLRYAWFLRRERRFDAAIDQLKIAATLDPLAAATHREIARTYYFQRRPDDCIQHADRALDIDPNFAGAFRTLGQCFEAKGLTDQAISAYQQAGRLALGNLGNLYALSGRRTDARQLADMLAKEPPRQAGVSLAMIYNGLGDRDAALSWLARASADGRQLPFAMRVADNWGKLRDDTRFVALLESNAVTGR